MVQCCNLLSALAADKVNMIAMATDDVVAKGAHAGNLIKSVASLVGGGGGGRLIWLRLVVEFWY